MEGFGCFENCSLPEDGLAAGLNVIIGPNEAGKSTLLDFVRFTLFGYPSGRSSRREPLRGGNHGGTIIYKVDNVVFRMYRGPGRNNFQLTTTDGQNCPETASETHFAGITKETFQDIFAFSLQELQSAKSLESGSDLLFSATVGQAAPRIRRAEDVLNHRAEKLFRERARAGPSAPLLAQLATKAREIERQLAELRQSAVGITLQLARRTTLQAKLQKTKEHQATLQQRRLDIQRVIDGWPHRQAKTDSEQRLASELPLVAFVGEIRDLAAEQAHYALAAQSVKSKSQQLRQRQEEWEQIQQDVGPGWDETVLTDFDVSLLAENNTETVIADLSLAENELHETDQEAIRLRREIEQLENEIEIELGLFPNLSGVSFRQEEVEESRAQLGRIRDALEERSALLQQIEAAQLNLRTARMQYAGVPKLPVQWIIPWLFSAVLALAAVWSLSNAHFTSGVIAAVFAILGLAVLAFRPRDQTIVTNEEKAAKRRVAEAEKELNAHDEKWKTISQGQKTDWPTAPASLSQRERELQVAAAAAKLQKHIRQKQIALQAADAAHSCAMTHRQAGFDDWQHFLAERKMPTNINPTTAREMFSRLRNGKRVLGVIKQLTDEIQSDGAVADRYLDRIRTFLNGRNRPVVASCRPEQLLATFEDFKSEVEQQESSRAELVTRNAAAADALRHMFGESGVPSAVLNRWQSEDPAGWGTEQENLVREVQELNETHDAELRELQALETEIERAVNSDRIAELELDHSIVQQEFKEALSDWCRAAIELELLGATRTQFEQSHQPKALNNAGRLFECVTGGKYNRIVMPIDTNDLRVQRDDGQFLELAELSRGAAEQLYLCARLGYVQHLTSDAHVEMPFLMDDVTVNFDPQRLSKVIELVVSCADGGQQVILFTCHPEVAKLAGTNFTCFELCDYKFTKIH